MMSSTSAGTDYVADVVDMDGGGEAIVEGEERADTWPLRLG